MAQRRWDYREIGEILSLNPEEVWEMCHAGSGGNGLQALQYDLEAVFHPEALPQRVLERSRGRSEPIWRQAEQEAWVAAQQAGQQAAGWPESERYVTFVDGTGRMVYSDGSRNF